MGPLIRKRKFTLSDGRFEIDNWPKVRDALYCEYRAYKREDTVYQYQEQAGRGMVITTDDPPPQVQFFFFRTTFSRLDAQIKL